MQAQQYVVYRAVCGEIVVVLVVIARELVADVFVIMVIFDQYRRMTQRVSHGAVP